MACAIRINWYFEQIDSVDDKCASIALQTGSKLIFNESKGRKLLENQFHVGKVLRVVYGSLWLSSTAANQNVITDKQRTIFHYDVVSRLHEVDSDGSFASSKSSGFHFIQFQQPLSPSFSFELFHSRIHLLSACALCVCFADDVYFEMINNFESKNDDI